MKIRSFILAMVISAGAVTSFAQKSELSNAKSSYERFSSLKEVGTLNSIGLTSLQTAKTSIDKASAHEKTLNDPATWTYKALIYSNLALLDSVPATSAPLITEAKSALEKAASLDKDGANKPQFEVVNGNFAQYYMNSGVRAYQAPKFQDAYSLFANSLTFRPGDTTLNYYAGLSAVNSKDYKSAIKSYNELTKTNFSVNNRIYLDLSKLYAIEKDTASAIRIASEGAGKFPGEADLITQEIELHLLTGKQKEIIGKIASQVEKEPTNKLFPFYLGIAYASANEPEKAEEAYKKAIAIDPGFTDANLNLGGLILNKGIDIYNNASKLPQSEQKKYDEMMKKAGVEFDKAFPYLQKATELSPKSRMAWENLKTYYLVKRNEAKVTEITKTINSL